MTGAWLIYAIMGAGLIAYVLTAGADFGGGVWDLLARGPRKEAQREAISHAIAPIWEANHVWLIFIIVLMFSAFPKAYAVIGIALHVPIVLALVGIVLRGTAFTFRAYGISPDATRRRWGRVFGWSSSFTPLFMGMALAGVSSSAIELNGTQVLSPLTAGWLSLFAVLVGLFALVLFMLLAAVYLTCDTDGELQHDFRARALASEGVAGVIALLVFLTAEGGALRVDLATAAGHCRCGRGLRRRPAQAPLPDRPRGGRRPGHPGGPRVGGRHERPPRHAGAPRRQRRRGGSAGRRGPGGRGHRRGHPGAGPVVPVPAVQTLAARRRRRRRQHVTQPGATTLARGGQLSALATAAALVRGWRGKEPHALPPATTLAPALLGVDL
jgi:hypothetical protein